MEDPEIEAIFDKIHSIPGFDHAFISSYLESFENYFEADVVQNGQPETFGLLHLTRDKLDIATFNLMCIADSSYIIKVHQVYTFDDAIIAVVDRLKYPWDPLNAGTIAERIECVFRVLRAIVYCQANMIKVTVIGEREFYFSDPENHRSIMWKPGFGTWMTDVVDYSRPESFYELCLSLFLAMYSEEIDQDNLDTIVFSVGGENAEPIRQFLASVRNGTKTDVLLRDPIFRHLPAAPPIGFKSVPAPPPVSDVTGLADLINLMLTKTDFTMKAFFTAIDMWYRTTDLIINGTEKNQAIFRIIRHLFDIQRFITLNLTEFKVITHLSGALFRSYLYDAASSLEQLILTYQYIVQIPQNYLHVDILRWFAQIPQGNSNKRVLAKDVF